MSNTVQLAYKTRLSSIGSADGTVRLFQALQWRRNATQRKLKLCSCSISRSIPNVYNYGGVNNGLIRVSNDDWSTHTDIQLDNGIYSAQQISNAINETISAWYTDPIAPAILIQTNSVLGKAYVELDQSKMASGTHIGIDFSQSLVYDLLGFVDTKIFSTTTTLTATASHMAKLDWFGNIMSISIEGFGNLSLVNADTSTEICQVALDANTGQNLYTVNTDAYAPVNIYIGNETPSYTISFKGSRDNKQILWTEGEISLVFQITEY